MAFVHSTITSELGHWMVKELGLDDASVSVEKINGWEWRWEIAGADSRMLATVERWLYNHTSVCSAHRVVAVPIDGGKGEAMELDGLARLKLAEHIGLEPECVGAELYFKSAATGRLHYSWTLLGADNAQRRLAWEWCDRISDGRESHTVAGNTLSTVGNCSLCARPTQRYEHDRGHEMHIRWVCRNPQCRHEERAVVPKRPAHPERRAIQPYTHQPTAKGGAHQPNELRAEWWSSAERRAGELLGDLCTADLRPNLYSWAVHVLAEVARCGSDRLDSYAYCMCTERGTSETDDELMRRLVRLSAWRNERKGPRPEKPLEREVPQSLRDELDREAADVDPKTFFNVDRGPALSEATFDEARRLMLGDATAEAATCGKVSQLGFTCDLPSGHVGEHKSHGAEGQVTEQWYTSAAAPSATDPWSTYPDGPVDGMSVAANADTNAWRSGEVGTAHVRGDVSYVKTDAYEYVSTSPKYSDPDNLRIDWRPLKPARVEAGQCWKFAEQPPQTIGRFGAPGAHGTTVETVDGWLVGYVQRMPTDDDWTWLPGEES